VHLEQRLLRIHFFFFGVAVDADIVIAFVGAAVLVLLADFSAAYVALDLVAAVFAGEAEDVAFEALFCLSGFFRFLGFAGRPVFGCVWTWI
jgi:hypothetical protein